MVCEKDERLAAADAKTRLIARAEAASIANYTRAHPAEALFTAFTAGLALGSRRDTFGSFLNAAGLIAKITQGRGIG